jgi:2-oxoisovalerate dehydrogenase E2 component (dihydrolipoyl transacylase)
MSIQIELPHVGESVTEGVIGKWLKNIGDTVEKYEPLLEVVTDKVNMEVPSPYNGTLTAILVDEGAVVPMGTPIAEMDADGVDGGEVSTEPEIKDKTTEISPPASSAGIFLKDVKPVGPTGSGEEPEIPPELLAKLGATETQTPTNNNDKSSKVRYSPVVRKLAAEKNIDLSKVKGTGLGGRVTKEDVMNFNSSADNTQRTTIEKPTSVVINPQEDETELKLTPLRRIIAENMIKSNEIPQAWSYHEVDVTNLVILRKNIRQQFIQKEGVDITYLPFVIKVVADALKSNPLLNSSWGGDKIIIKNRINLGIAMAAPHGLVVPVIHNADTMSIAGLAKYLKNLIDRALENKLTLDDVQGGTFTVNNTGALGSIVSQPLVNPPQVGILTTEAIVKRVVVNKDGAMAIRDMMNVCMSFDHRVVDGAESGNFMRDVRDGLQKLGEDTIIY